MPVLLVIFVFLQILEGIWSRSFHSYSSIYFFSKHAVLDKKDFKQLLFKNLDFVAQEFVSHTEQKVTVWSE